MNGTHQLLVCSDDVIKRNTKALLNASKKIGLELNTDKLSSWLCLATKIQENFTL